MLLVVMLSGCGRSLGTVNARWLKQAELVYQMEEGQKDKAPFERKTFTDPAFLKLLADAMNSSREIGGELDYGVEFRMMLTYGDGYTENYILNLGQETGYQGLLVAESSSSKGYSISVKKADRLRAYVYSGSEAEEPSSVTTDGPLTISRTDLYPLTGERAFLNLQLWSGSYSEDWTNLSPLGGRQWSGKFRLTVAGDAGNTLSSYTLEGESAKEELSFGRLFDIQFGDYNGDESPDFTIGQYASGNGYVYKIFTLKNNKVEELTIRQHPWLFLSGGEEPYSIKLNEVPGGFQASHYDNSLGGTLTESYRWTGELFEKAER
ncbi:hypothetical protein [Paenibacillus tengchongensis]|uniref:hypothetical protein n=1 Tax=Paenibacillus tengchongensis TaxID=2608684 RepID=UPI00124C7DE9|nr:hypothetical protein [Paenibacillus tengchongensis]